MTLNQYQDNINQSIDEIKNLALHKLDSQTKELKKAFDISYDKNIFKLHDMQTDEQIEAKFKLFTELTKYSGSLVFLGIQILAANNFMTSANFSLKDKYFKRKTGIAINHLRAPFTVISSKKCDAGYLLDGTLTWASGYGIFDALLVGFHHEGYEYTAMTDFKESERFIIGKPVESFVGEGMSTVNIELNEFFVADEHIVTTALVGSYTQGKSISKTVHIAMYSLGLGAIEQIKDKEFKNNATLKLQRLKDKFMASNDAKAMDKIRISLFKLVQDIISIGMILSGGSSILADKHLQRYYRELIMFNSNGLNDGIKGLFKESF